MTTLYYLTDYSDEVMPCAPTPEAWARWLAEGDPDWGDGLPPATPGQTFKARALTIFAWVSTVLGQDGLYRLPDGSPQADFAAIVDGEGETRWLLDDILDPARIERGLAENHADEVCVALGRWNVTPILATYHGPGLPVSFTEVAEH